MAGCSLGLTSRALSSAYATQEDLPPMLSSALSARLQAVLNCSKLPLLLPLAAIALIVSLPAGVYAANNPVPFVDIVSPVSVNPGSTNVTLTVKGTGFISTSTVSWNATPLATTFISSTKLTAVIPDGFVAAVGLGSVLVTSA